MISLKPWICLFDALGTSTTVTHSPMLGSENNGDSSCFIRDRFRKKTSEKNTSKTLKILEISNFLDFLESLHTFCLKQTKHPQKIWQFLFKFSTTPENCKLLWIGKNLAWASRGDMEKYISKLNVCPWTPRTYGEMKVLHTKIWVK